MYFNICSHCGANLDPGEKCECAEKEGKKENILSIGNEAQKYG